MLADEKNKKRGGRRIRPPVWLIILAVCAAVNAAAWFSTPFSDIYTDHVFHPISSPLMMIMSAVPFSFGELLILLGVILVIVGLPAAVVSAAALKKHRKKILVFTAKFFAWVIVYITVTETLNCFVQYHNTLASDKYFPDAPDGYTPAELTAMCEYIIEQADDLVRGRVDHRHGGRFLGIQVETAAVIGDPEVAPVVREGAFDRLAIEGIVADVGDAILNLDTGEPVIIPWRIFLICKIGHGA